MNGPLCWDVADEIAKSAMRVERPNEFEAAVRNNWVVSEALAAPSSSCRAVTLVTKARKFKRGLSAQHSAT